MTKHFKLADKFMLLKFSSSIDSGNQSNYEFKPCYWYFIATNPATNWKFLIEGRSN